MRNESFEWHVIYNAILSNVSDLELKELLEGVEHPKLTQSGLGGNDVTLTFECFLNSTPKQVELLLESFPELLDKAGHYFAFHGKQDIVHSLMTKGCNLNFVAIGAIKGLRAFETQELIRIEKIYTDAKRSSSDYSIKIENEYQAQEGHLIKAEAKEMYQTKMNLLDTLALLDKMTDKNLDQEEICSSVATHTSYKIIGYDKAQKLESKYFIESGTLKAINEAIIKISPECNLRDKLYDIAMESYNKGASNLYRIHEMYSESSDLGSNQKEEHAMLNKIFDTVFKRAEAQDFYLEVTNDDLLTGVDSQYHVDFS